MPPAVRRRIAVMALSAALGGAVFGGVAGTVGLDPASTIAFAGLAFSSGAQWATLTLLDQGAALPLLAGAALVASLRFIPMSASVAAHLPRRPFPRALASHLVIDPCWALAQSRPECERRRVLLGAGAAIWAASTAGTAVGALTGLRAEGALARGVAVLVPLLLLELLLPLLSGRRERVAAAAGAAAALVAAPLGVPGGGVLVATPIAALLAWAGSSSR